MRHTLYQFPWRHKIYGAGRGINPVTILWVTKLKVQSISPTSTKSLVFRGRRAGFWVEFSKKLSRMGSLSLQTAQDAFQKRPCHACFGDTQVNPLTPRSANHQLPSVLLMAPSVYTGIRNPSTPRTEPPTRLPERYLETQWVPPLLLRRGVSPRFGERWQLSLL